jgi:CheY-like chemotaxis protein
VDLVLSDIHMPEMSGLQLMDTIKQANPHLPVVLITGYGVDNSPSDFHQSQADALLYKPFKIADLKQTIENALGIGISYAEAVAHS